MAHGHCSSCWILLLSILLPLPCLASGDAHNAVVILLDDSGSLRKTDPACLRGEAAQLLISLLPDGDRIVVAQFGDDVRPLVGGDSFVVLTPDSRARISAAAGECQSDDAKTDIVRALEYARFRFQQLNATDRAAFRPALVFLTDGKDDVPAAEDRSNEILDRARLLGEADVPVYTVGLSSGADQRLLRQLADLSRGDHQQLDEPDQLLAGFFALSRAFGNRWPLGNWTGAGSHQLPPWSSRAVVLALGGGGLSSQPGSTLLQKLRSCSVYAVGGQRGFSLTLHPDRANATLLADAEGSLTIAPTIPGRVAAGVAFPCKAEVLPSGGDQLGNPDFLRSITVIAEWTGSVAESRDVLYDDGRHEDGSIGDGIFGGFCTAPEQGQQRIRFTARAPLAPTLTNDLTTSVMEAPTSIAGPGMLQQFLLAPFLSRLQVRIHNETLVKLRARISQTGTASTVTEPAQEVVLNPEQTLVVTVPVLATLFSTRSISLLCQIVGAPGPPVKTTVAVPGRIWPISMIGLVAIAILSSFVFPRRSAVGSMISVQVEICNRVFAESVQVYHNGAISVPQIPDPFAQVGSFAGRSGIWTTGILFTPPEDALIRFQGRIPRRSKHGYLIRRTCSWSRTGDGVTAHYTFRAPTH